MEQHGRATLQAQEARRPRVSVRAIPAKLGKFVEDVAAGRSKIGRPRLRSKARAPRRQLGARLAAGRAGRRERPERRPNNGRKLPALRLKLAGKNRIKLPHSAARVLQGPH